MVIIWLFSLKKYVELNEYASLSKKQIALYKQLLEQIKEKKFKQICNHPDQYLGTEEYKLEHSGIFEQLRVLKIDVLAVKSTVWSLNSFPTVN